ncbi:hypothetical protein [Sphingobacterium multivorum]|uniref:hypothetical protein n=1 Tax=Sphingobacterium multivorum TaxID=28454 RepID=UPI000E0FED51|nr:hypothetical protein [Sphingobacterium multivorum]QQT46098.1 hypothetical protein I6J00_05365 [Sphingobacterium multivorum]
METIISFLKTAPSTVLIGIAIGLRLWIGMRRFNRRGIGGLQHFSNYFVGLASLFAEFLIWWTANILIVWGLYRLLFE